MRILTVANHVGSRGGLERTQLTICSALAHRGHEVDLLYVSEGDFVEHWRRFARVMVPIAGSLPRRAHAMASSRAVLHALRVGRRLSPEVIYVFRYWDIPYAIALGRLSGAPVVFHLCLPPPRRLPWWLGASLRGVRRVLAVSRDTAARWEGSGLPVGRTEVVLTGIDLHHYRPAETDVRHATRQELGLEESSFVVLYAGRIDREKGVDVLVRAFADLASRHPHCRLVVVGSASLGADPQDSERYAAELRALAEGAPVSWIAGRRDILDLIQAADVAAVPSLWPEPLSRSVMEPLGCGVPVVASRVGGNPEMLTDWLAQFLFEPGDDKGLSDLLGSLHGWRQDRPELGQRCRREAVDRFSLDSEIDTIEDRLAHTTGAHRRQRRRV